jgi:hypothetical protein
LLKSQQGNVELHHAVADMTGHGFRGLHQLGRRAEAAELLREVTDWLLDGKGLEHLTPRRGQPGPGIPTALPRVAGGWLALGQDRRAQPILAIAREQLFGESLGFRDQVRLGCAYAGAVGQAPVGAAMPLLRELLERLPPIRDNFTTQSHYGLSQLQIIDAVVLAAVGEARGRCHTGVE